MIVATLNLGMNLAEIYESRRNIRDLPLYCERCRALEERNRKSEFSHPMPMLVNAPSDLSSTLR